MANLSTIQELHTAGPQLIGFDYQFYYFMYLALGLKQGEKVGFEVKDDLHIEKPDGTIFLFQSKHSIHEKDKEVAKNLTTLDNDLWKTLSHWTDMVKADYSMLSNHSFCLVTNKGAGNNSFISALSLFKSSLNIDPLIDEIKSLRDKTSDNQIKKFLKNILTLTKKKAANFFSKVSIKTSTVGVINLIKTRILECVKNQEIVDPVFESLSSNMAVAKYTDIQERKKFEITFKDFNSKFNKCFKIAFSHKPLPKRNFDINLPDNLHEQIFIKQLMDIGEIDSDSPKIVVYTTQMLESMNQLAYWAEDNYVLPIEMQEFLEESITRWENEFTSKYRQVLKQIKSGINAEQLEISIKDLGVELIDYIRRENLTIAGTRLETRLSNGHFYALSDKPEIGWHFDWKKKYKQ